MIILHKGKDLLRSSCPVKVNTVNVVGVMGKGIALQFKNAYPDMFWRYKKLCSTKSFNAGDIWFDEPTGTLCAATKQHWRDPSTYEWVNSCIIKIERFMGSNEYNEIALPLLGCGNGGLDKDKVLDMMDEYFISPNVIYNIYL